MCQIVEIVVSNGIPMRTNVGSPARSAMILLDFGDHATSFALRVERVAAFHGDEYFIDGPQRRVMARLGSCSDRHDVLVGRGCGCWCFPRTDDSISGHVASNSPVVHLGSGEAGYFLTPPSWHPT